MPGTVLSILRVVFYLIFSPTLWNRYYNNLDFTGEEIETQIVDLLKIKQRTGIQTSTYLRLNKAFAS